MPSRARATWTTHKKAAGTTHTQKEVGGVEVHKNGGCYRPGPPCFFFLPPPSLKYTHVLKRVLSLCSMHMAISRFSFILSLVAVHVRVRRHVQNAALVGGAALFEEDVAVHAPGRAPRILDLPVLGFVVGPGAVAHREHAVVQPVPATILPKEKERERRKAEGC